MEEISVAQAAELCALSESHFMKSFRDMTGTSFIRYVKNYRLEVAARLLAESDSKVIDIAAECGFPSPSYFTRAFESKHGIAPQEFRRKARDNF